MNSETGDDAEDWFAKFEREAREAADRAAVPAQPAQPPEPDVPLVDPPALVNPFDPTGFPQFEPAPHPPMPSWEPMATQAMSIEPEPTQLNPVVEPTQALVPAPLRPPTGEPGSGIDALFGDTAFREYQPGPDPNEAPFARRPSKEMVRVDGGDGGELPPHGLGTPQRVLIGVGGGLLAVIALIALFLVGTRLPDLLGPAPAIATPTPTPTPTKIALPVGPVDPGSHSWNELAGGECLEPYVDAWQQEYTVVDCADPHAGQMVYRAWFPESLPDSPDQTFPGAEALQTEITLLCSAPGVVDLAAAGAYNDAQIQGAYPVTKDQWKTDPSYYCFISRSSGDPMTGSVAVPPAPATTG